MDIHGVCIVMVWLPRRPGVAHAKLTSNRKQHATLVGHHQVVSTMYMFGPQLASRGGRTHADRVRRSGGGRWMPEVGQQVEWCPIEDLLGGTPAA